MTLRVAIAGASGRMGRMLIETTLAATDCSLAAALDRPGAPELGRDAGEFLGRAAGVRIGSVRAPLGGGVCRIGFRRPVGTGGQV
ncbi:MAG: 4-hydroxy-tetrahydrodipicolinate reductase, partial [Betaproteobacteria bacterium]